MSNQYGPALVIGILIGGAILLDDVITPPQPRFHPPFSVHGGELLPEGHHGVWIGEPGEGPLHREHHGPESVKKAVRLHLAPDSSTDGPATAIELELDVEGGGDAPPHEAIVTAVNQVLKQAQAQGREPTPEEIESALKDAGVEQTEVDVRVLVLDEDESKSDP